METDSFWVNDFIELKLVGAKTIIYVANIEFMICKTLLLNIPLNKVSSYDGIQSIDDIEETIERMETIEFEIPPEVEFWAHCSV